MSATVSGFLRSTTSRTTVSTSVSDSATVHREPVDELLQRRVRGERRLAGGDDEHLAVETRRAALDDVLDLLGALALSSSMYCCISSRTTRVSGSLPFDVALQPQDFLHDVEHLVVGRCRRPSGTGPAALR